MVLIDPDIDRCEGAVLLHVYKSKGKKILVASFQPAQSYVFQVDNQELFDGILKQLKVFARDNDFDTVSGLRMGADDYLTKDISLPHLIARIAALFRRLDVMDQTPSSEDIVERGKLRVDAKRMKIHWQDSLVELTVTEFWMVFALARFSGHVKTRLQLMQESKMVVDDSTITSHIKRIRKKFVELDPSFDCISTVYGVGYRWNDLEE